MTPILPRRIFIPIALPFLFAGCSLDPYQLDDPTKIVGIGPKTSEIVKSIKCELTTFLVEDRLRSRIHDGLIKEIQSDFINDKMGFETKSHIISKYPFVELDQNQSSFVNVDFKNVNAFNLSLSYDWKKPSTDAKGVSPTLGSTLRAGDLRDYHAGPAYSDTGTFELIQTYGIPQDSDLGSSKSPLLGKTELPKAVKYTTVYNVHYAPDEDFYCYRSLSERLTAKNLIDATEDVQSLLVGKDDTRKFENFHRISIGGVTLARWLQTTVTDAVSNQVTIFYTKQSMYLGQITYNFTLDIKPSIDLKYTLVAGLTSPLVPDLGGSLEHSSAFSIVINTPNALGVLAARGGAGETNASDGRLLYTDPEGEKAARAKEKKASKK